MAFNPATGNYESLADTGYSVSQIDSFFNGLVAKYGSPYQQGDRESLIAKLVGGSGYIAALGGDPGKAFGEFEAQYARRGAADTTPTLEGSGGVDSSLLNVGTTRTALASVVPSGPAPVASIITTAGATAPRAEVPTSGPIGLAYAGDPVNYATGEVGPQFAYNGDQSGLYSSPTAAGGYGGSSGGGVLGIGPAPLTTAGTSAAGGSNTMLYLLLAGMAAAAYFLLKK
jgi:hypothetical protein